MRKIFLLLCIGMLISSISFALAFSPTKLVLDAPDFVQYTFDGSKLKIPVEVSGTAALTYFFVYTKDKADDIVAVHNGFLGWHYVNKIDTCVYMSSPYSLHPGTNEVTWDGKDSEGGSVPTGDYSYYLWAFDNESTRIKMTEFRNPGVNSVFIEKDEAGQPMANPIYMGGIFRWVVGNDPDDDNLVEKTSFVMPAGFSSKYIQNVQPDDHSILYIPAHNADSSTGALFRYQWVPAGEAIQDTDFEVTWGQISIYHMNAVCDGNYVYVTENNYKELEVRAPVHIIDYDFGEHVGEIDLGDWWGSIEDYDAGAQMNGGPGTMSIRNGMLYLGCHCSCLRQVLNPMLWFDNVDDVVVWVNDNGDYVLDHNFEETAGMPWVCNDFNVGPYAYNFRADANGFSGCPAFDMGAVSFGMLAPDGTGIGYLAFAGETANQKNGIDFLDNGSAYDGLYASLNEPIPADGTTGTLAGTWYVGHDSIMGTITSGVGVKEEAPAAFAVAQNSPNPFNPTTTISFSLAEAGTVTIDVYNVAGQKVDTIVNEFMDAGSHSVVWDATEFSAGVYFYTVKSGEFSKTTKMTLLR